MDVFTLKQQILETVELAALGMAKQMFPAFDDVKYEDAYKMAGSERYLKYLEKKKLVNSFKRGGATNSPRYYSRLEIAAAKKAEEVICAKFK